MEPFQFQEQVKPEWVDYNGHMNDAEYAKVFSHTLDAFMKHLGFTQEMIQEQKRTFFTLETHLSYLKEAHEGDSLSITMQLIDHDPKRLHIFFTMKNEQNEPIATSEQMLMGMDTSIGRPAPFLSPIQQSIDMIWAEHKSKEKPNQVGRSIGIRRK